MNPRLSTDGFGHGVFATHHQFPVSRDVAAVTELKARRQMVGLQADYLEDGALTVVGSFTAETEFAVSVDPLRIDYGDFRVLGLVVDRRRIVLVSRHVAGFTSSLTVMIDVFDQVPLPASLGLRVTSDDKHGPVDSRLFGIFDLPPFHHERRVLVEVNGLGRVNDSTLRDHRIGCATRDNGSG